jgi:hypothetical protein
MKITRGPLFLAFVLSLCLVPQGSPQTGTVASSSDAGPAHGPHLEVSVRKSFEVFEHGANARFSTNQLLLDVFPLADEDIDGS